MVKKLKLTTTSQYEEVYKKGKTWSNETLVMRALSNTLGASRFGFVVSKRVGKAVLRNRIKRLMRQNVAQMNIKPGWDLVFIARKGAAAADYYDIQDSVTRLLLGAGLLTSHNLSQPSGVISI